MKTLLTLAFVILGLNNAICQDSENDIEFKAIHIINSANKSYAMGSKAALQKAFGKATIKKEPDEVLDGYAYTYKYPGFETYFNEQNWEATSVTGKGYTVILNKLSCKIGDPISKFKDHFPASYKNREKRYKNQNILRLGILSNKQPVDSFVFITYDDNGRITEISIANNNS